MVEIIIDGPTREELRRLADRAAANTYDPRGLTLRNSVRRAFLDAEKPGSSPYRIELGNHEISLIGEQAPWIARHYPEVFGEIEDPFKTTDHGIAERLRGKTIEDVVITRSGSGIISNVKVHVEDGDAIEITLPFGFRLKSRPPRPSELAMARAEEGRR